jgi:hypothetical protein
MIKHIILVVMFCALSCNHNPTSTNYWDTFVKVILTNQLGQRVFMSVRSIDNYDTCSLNNADSFVWLIDLKKQIGNNLISFDEVMALFKEITVLNISKTDTLLTKADLNKTDFSIDRSLGEKPAHVLTFK